jgi:hypothetical protein
VPRAVKRQLKNVGVLKSCRPTPPALHRLAASLEGANHRDGPIRKAVATEARESAFPTQASSLKSQASRLAQQKTGAGGHPAGARFENTSCPWASNPTIHYGQLWVSGRANEPRGPNRYEQPMLLPQLWHK